MKQYLDDKYVAIKRSFLSQTKPGEDEIIRRIDILNKQIAENADFMKHLEYIKRQFNEEIVPNVLENFLKTGQLVNFYRRMTI